MDLVPEVLDIRLRPTGTALAVVRIGPIEFRGIHVYERDGRLRIRAPCWMDEGLFLQVLDAVQGAYRQAVVADPWARERWLDRGQ